MKFGYNSIGTNSLRVMGVNIDVSRDYSSDFRDMLVGTEADVIFVELGFTASQHFSCHMECRQLS